MKVDTLANVKNHFSAVVEHLGREPLFITRNGKVAAVLQGVTDDEVEDYLLRNSPKLWRLIDERRGRARRGRTIPFDASRYQGGFKSGSSLAIREKPASYRKKKRVVGKKRRA